MVRVFSELVDGGSYAERYVVTVVTHDGASASSEVFVFGELDDAGRSLTVEELSIAGAYG